MNARTIQREIEREARKAQDAQRAANIAHFHDCHDRWRALVGLPPLVRRADGRVVGVFQMGVRRG